MGKRMVSTDVIASDKFLNLTEKQQLLYIHLLLLSDDDGICGQGKTAIAITKAEFSDFLLLEKAGFIYLFESGVVYVRDFHKMNRIPRAHYTPSVYTEELAAIRRGDILSRGRLC